MVEKNAEHKFGEAFCLMLYQGQTSKRVVDIWNSRNGVTSFMVDIDGEEYQHIAFSFDRCVPDHQLRPGDYFFRDITEVEAERYAAQVVDRNYPRATEGQRARKIAELAPGMFRHSSGAAHPYLDRAPFIEVVDYREEASSGL